MAPILSFITNIHPQYYSLTCILLLLLLLMISFQFISRKSSNRRLPPSPPSLPLIGHLHHFRSFVHKSLQNLSSRYGPLLYLRLGLSSKIILISSPSIAETIFKKDEGAFSSRPSRLSPFKDNLLFGRSGFSAAPYGSYWRFMKKLCMTKLLSTQQIKRTRHIRREEIKRLLNMMIQSASRNEAINMESLLTKLTNNIICRMAVSTRCSEEEDEAEKLRGLVKGSFELASKTGIILLMGPLKKLGIWYFAKQVDNMSKKYDELLEKLLKDHEEKVTRSDEDKDLMEILLEVYHDENAEFRITRAHIKAFIVDLLVAGTSSSAETMQWALAELINHPNVVTRVREELERVVGTSRLVEESDIPSLPYLQAVVKETLRLHPNLPKIQRVCVEDFTIQGFHIPKNSILLFNVYAIMRDPGIWEDPTEFRPERFLISSDSEIMSKGHNFNFFPFGGGRRACPGMNLAYSMMYTTIAAVIQCFDLKVGGERDYETKVDMEERSYATGGVLVLASPLKCFPVVHFNPFSFLDNEISCSKID